MSEYIKVSGKTVEDAITNACTQLQVPTMHLEYEVLEQGSNGFFGIFSKPAIIKARKKNDFIGDGKEFLETKSYILSTREQLRNCKDKYIEFFTEDKIMSYINDKGLDSYYIDLYKDEFVGDIENDDSDQIVEGAIDELILLLDRTELVINFLSSNQDDWQIENDHIVFSSDSLSNEYDSLLEQVVS